MPAPAPLAPHERLFALDALRGFALFGILAVNMAHFCSPALYWDLAGIDPWDRPWDDAVQVLLRLLAEGKFYPVFSLLFGAGMVVFAERAASRGAAPGRLFARRLFVLLVIGALHAVLVWSGDILLTYALVGFLLLPFVRRSARAMWAWGLGCIALALGLYALLVGPRVGTAAPEQVVWAREMADRSLDAFARGTYAEQVQMRLVDLALLYGNAPVLFPFLLGLFLLGAGAMKARWIERLPATRPLLCRTLGVGLAVGLPFTALGAYAEGQRVTGMTTAADLLGFVGYALGGLGLALVYAAGIVLAAERPAWRRFLAPMAAAGRMALTNYLLQSLVSTALFYRYGLGLYGRVSPLAGLGLTVAIYAVQVAVSAWWLHRFRFGPAEWLWRSLVYGRWQPLRYRHDGSGL